MNVDLAKCVRMSSNARIKIINEFFPDFSEEMTEKNLSDAELSLHSGALCLYAATMLTKIYDKSDGEIDSSLNEIELESNDRELALQDAIRKLAKYSHYTEEQIKKEAHKMLLRDIRNSFAHGNFRLMCNTHTKKLFFVLLPERKGIQIDEPIVISKNSLKKALTKTLTNTATKYRALPVSALREKASSNLNEPLQSLMLPTELMKLADHYLENKQRFEQKLKIDEKRAKLIQYALVITQISYEQDDYYQIFGKDSNIFNKIALVRNSNAHNNLVFGNLAKRIIYTDRNKTLDESFKKSITSLLIANQLKTDLLPLMNEGKNIEAVEDMKNQLAEAFDYFFTDNGGCMLEGIRKFVQKHRDEFLEEDFKSN